MQILKWREVIKQFGGPFTLQIRASGHFESVKMRYIFPEYCIILMMYEIWIRAKEDPRTFDIFRFAFIFNAIFSVQLADTDGNGSVMNGGIFE